MLFMLSGLYHLINIIITSDHLCVKPLPFVSYPEKMDFLKENYELSKQNQTLSNQLEDFKQGISGFLLHFNISISVKGA